MLTIISLVISGIALLISIITFFTNKAKHNLQQLQKQYYLFCDKFQTLLNFGNYQSLINFKYDLENIVIISPNESQSLIKYNELQKRTSQDIDSCKNAYAELIETLDFFETNKTLNRFNKYKENEFVKWLNETINDFYLRLNNHYTALYNIHEIAKLAQLGNLVPGAFEEISAHYHNIYRIITMQETLVLLKREMTGVFSQSSIKSISLFWNNTIAIKKIEKHFLWFIKNYGLNEVIQKCDYTKISNTYKSITDIFKDYIKEEEKQFTIFINMLLEQSRRNKKK